MRELHFQHGPPATRAGPISCWCEWIFDAVFAFFLSLYLCCIYDQISCQLFSTNVVIWSYTTVPVAFRLPFLCIFMEVQERYLPIIRGAGMRFPCVSKHFNHCLWATRGIMFSACPSVCVCLVEAFCVLVPTCCWLLHWFITITIIMQCFDTVVWATGRASGL